jgi:transposase
MDNSMCHKGAKITEKLEKRHITRAPHPPYSPNLSPHEGAKKQIENAEIDG